MSFILLGFVASLLGFLLWTFVQHERTYGHLRKIFPECWWYFIKRSDQLKNPDSGIEILFDLYKTFKDNAVVALYPHLKLIVFEPKLAEWILSTNLNKTDEYAFIGSWLFEGLLTAKTEQWKSHKKLLVPAFNLENLQKHIHSFNEQSLVLCNKLQTKLDQPSFNIHEYVYLCTLDMILNTVLGADIHIQDNPSLDYITSVKTMCNILYLRTFTYYKFSWWYRFSSYHNDEQKASKILNDFSNHFITERRNSKSVSGIRTMLDMLLECEELTDQDICAEINTFIFAGHETTGSTLSFALFELSRNSEVQTKVYQEILEVVGDDNSPTYKDLENMTYTSMVLKEVSRLYPGVPIITRQISKEIKWKDTVLPKGLNCYFPLFVMHRTDKYFPDPEKFNPERFTPENIKKLTSGAYVPFSTAPRGCIGQKFAQLEMKTILVHLLRQFEVLPDWDHNLKLIAKVTLQSKNGVKISLKKRKKCDVY